MKNDLHIALVQYDIAWQNRESNLEKIEEILSQTDSTKFDLIVLPETFTTGFAVSTTDYAETMDGEAVEWMKKKAKKLDSVLCGSVIMKDGGHFYNRLLFVYPDGDIQFYNKRHLFGPGDESNLLAAGQKQCIVYVQGWRIFASVCYDLRFPVWSRNRNNYDIFLNLSNWPGVRQDVWNTLLKARALENQVYTIGVNRVGSDGKNIDYLGESQVISPKGKIMLNAEKAEGIMDIKLNKEELEGFREKFPVWKDADDFSLNY